MMNGVIDVNDEQRRRMVRKVRAALGAGPGGGLRGALVAVLGLTFKAGTDDLRDSPSLTMVRSCWPVGRRCGPSTRRSATGPTGPRRSRWTGIELVGDPFAAATGADVLVIATEWPEFAKLDLAAIAAVMADDAVIVDTRNLLDPAAVRAAGLGYDGVGRR